MKRYFEIFIVTFVIFIIVYSLLYMYAFNSVCNRYAWINENNPIMVIGKLASCKDSVICRAENIETNKRNEIVNWSCTKKDSPIYSSELYINIYNHLKNSITK